MRSILLIVTSMLSAQLCATTIEIAAFDYELTIKLQGNLTKLLDGDAETIGGEPCKGRYSFSTATDQFSVTFDGDSKSECAAHNFEANLSFENVVDMLNGITLFTTLRSHRFYNQPINAKVKALE